MNCFTRLFSDQQPCRPLLLIGPATRILYLTCSVKNLLFIEHEQHLRHSRILGACNISVCFNLNFTKKTHDCIYLYS